jgi:chaperonin GroEL
LEEGIVAGGGVALLYSVATDKYSYTDIETSIYKSLTFPYLTILNNGSTINLNKSMFEQNIIDPLKVTRCALDNAVSVAKTVLSTDCIVLNPSIWN